MSIEEKHKKEKDRIIDAQIQALLKQSHLAQQSLDNLNLDEINPLTPEIISRQATQNIGTIGHVAHGKSTLVLAVSGVNTVRHQKEKIRNITIKLGYANAKLYRCPFCPAPECYQPFGSKKEDQAICKNCGNPLLLLRHVSFVDCPGHDVLMATMLAGAAVMDSALLLVAGNQTCPQPQTSEHLAAVEIMDLDQIIILQNKIDIIINDPSKCIKHQEDIKKFINGTIAEGAPIIPISAQKGYNIDAVVDYLCRIPIPQRDFISPPQMIIIRSFDVNKPGEMAETLKGGVAGGTILQGVLKVGDRISIRPGLVTRNQTTGAIQWKEIQSIVVTLKADENQLMYAVPGGLIGVGMKVDPCITRSDALVGQIIGHPNHMPEVVSEIEVKFYLLKRLLGVQTKKKTDDGAVANIGRIKTLSVDEQLMINVGSQSLAGRISSVPKKDKVKIEFTRPVCANIGDKIALSRRVDNNFRLIGWGEIKKCLKAQSSQQREQTINDDAKRVTDEWIKSKETDLEFDAVFLIYKFLNFPPDLMLKGLSSKKEAELKSYYHLVAKLLHPDKNSHPLATEVFQKFGNLHAQALKNMVPVNQQQSSSYNPSDPQSQYNIY